MNLTPADIATVRELIAYARANGWTHYTFPGTVGGTDGAEHLWRLDKGTYDRHSAKVSLWEGGLSYYEPDNRDAIATLPARSAAMVADWLRLLGLVPTVAQVAVAMLSDAAVVLAGEVHTPVNDDGALYCGWSTGTTVIDGCGHVWPCPTVRAR